MRHTPMIRRIQALNYRCLRHVDVALDPFHVLVGPNASGKSTLFDVVTFLGDMVRMTSERLLESAPTIFKILFGEDPKTVSVSNLRWSSTSPNP